MPVRGRFLWHELLTTDVSSAFDFYSRVAGWGKQVWEQNPAYAMFTARGVPFAGLMVLPEQARAMGAPPHWLCYIGTPDIDRTVREVVELGGRVLQDTMTIESVGRMAVFADPQGAVFAGYTPDREPAGDDPSTELYMWHELAASDPVAALEFYRQVFGWEKTDAMDMGPGMGVYQMYGIGGKSLGGIYAKAKGSSGPAHWLPYAAVSDADAVARATKASGGTVLNGPMEVPGGDWIVQAMDPQGAVFAVHAAPASMAAAPAAAKPAAKRAAAAKKAAPARKTAARRKPKAKKAAARKPVGRKKAAAGKKRAGKKTAGSRKTAGRKKAAGRRKTAARKSKPAKRRSRSRR